MKEVRLEVLATKLYVFKLKHNKRIIASGPFFYAQNVKVLLITIYFYVLIPLIKKNKLNLHMNI